MTVSKIFCGSRTWRPPTNFVNQPLIQAQSYKLAKRKLSMGMEGLYLMSMEIFMRDSLKMIRDMDMRELVGGMEITQSEYLMKDL